jgi:hypothetical protein
MERRATGSYVAQRSSRQFLHRFYGVTPKTSDALQRSATPSGMTFNQVVVGSIPTGLTTMKIKNK